MASTATTLALSLSPASIAADGVATSTATATAKDVSNVGVTGDTVTITSNDSGQTIGTVTDVGNGTYTATITSSTTAHAVTVTATDSSATLTHTATLTQTVVVSVPFSGTVTWPASRDTVIALQFNNAVHVTSGTNTATSPGIFFGGLTNGDTHGGVWDICRSMFASSSLSFAVAANTNFYLRCQGDPGTGVFTLTTDHGTYAVTLVAV